MRQHLVVVGHRFLVERRAHRARDLDGRQLPEPAEQPLGRAAHEHDLVLSFEPHQRARELGELVRLLADGHHRQLALTTGAIRRARLRERAGEAARLRRRAHGRTELHQALVELARRAPCGQGSHQLGRLRPRRLLPGGRLDVVLDREHAGEHARDVSVDQRRALAVRDRGDRTGGVRPDAGHVAQPGRGRRQRLADALRAAVEVPRARVVAEAGPRGEHVVERRRRRATPSSSRTSDRRSRSATPRRCRRGSRRRRRTRSARARRAARPRPAPRRTTSCRRTAAATTAPPVDRSAPRSPVPRSW